MGKMTEEDRLMRRINQRFMKGVMNYRLIEWLRPAWWGTFGGGEFASLTGRRFGSAFAYLSGLLLRMW